MTDKFPEDLPPMTRHEKKEAKRKAWLATPPGHIAKPMRFIERNSELGRGAEKFARAGRGNIVQAMARTLMLRMR